MIRMMLAVRNPIKTALLLVTTLLIGVGCNPLPEPDDGVRTSCSPAGYGRVDLEYGADCKVVAHNFDAARELVSKRIGAGRFNELFSGAIVRVLDSGTIHGDHARDYTDQTTFDGITEILIPSGGGMLVHAMYHTVETADGVLDTYDHPNWWSNGFYADSNTYFHDSWESM